MLDKKINYKKQKCYKNYNYYEIHKKNPKIDYKLLEKHMNYKK